MITAAFYKSANLLCGFKISGHSDYTSEGEDIVCAAVSSAAYMTANTVTDVQHINAEVADSDGLMTLSLPQSEAERAQDILLGLKLHLTALSRQYDFIKVKISEV